MTSSGLREKRSVLRAAFLMAVLAAIAMGAPAEAQQAEDLESLTKAEAAARAEKAKLDRERAAIRQEINDLKRALADATAETQAFERERARLAETLSEVTGRLVALEARQVETRAQAMTLLASLQRLQLSPSAVVIANPDDAVATAQAARLIDSLTGELSQRAEALARLAEDLAATRTEAQDRQLELDANNRELLRQRDRVRALVAQKEAARATLDRDAAAAAAEVDRLAAESANLRELLERLAQPVPDAAPSLKPRRPDTSAPVVRAPGTARFADAKGAVLLPVSGTLARQFGRGEAGQTYAATSEAQVVAPYSGRVEFAGPFKGHRRVVILNLDDGYFLLLTGLEQVFVSTSETVVKGESIGVMPSGSAPQLYLELRRDGRTIDPAPWLG